ncbi:MAG TPA: histidine triad nucleotide-binding protein [Bacillota bacterium]|jgi:histidine triad (HIT) family protein|nr:histidine triad nucleotide-binding protein [Bacillota bacterium]HOB87592.1 histidine triad nucleotide-binding protein [Bacillota bacterium]HOP69451.1 histidine triad nucleotide-binding protein [Bacillota bacterium]HPT34443.1 histidine triad nucleotide-binding protein [Bacillota bacterium]HQD06419.1 histidine triad nucleotide-binding protein [Bacillota bacterium]
MSSDCIFCKIAGGQLETELVYEDSEIVAFKDINPQAPVHLLIIPRRHVPSLLDLQEDDADLAGRLLLTANRLARTFKIDQSGYRVLTNCGKDAGQAVSHLHLHLLGGRPLLQTMG